MPLSDLKKQQDLRRAKIMDTALQNMMQGSGGVFDQLTNLQQTVGGILQVQNTALAAPTANLLYNGELGHSVYTWYEVSGTPSGDKNAECVFFYSNNIPTTAVTFISTDVDAGTDSVDVPGHGMTTGTVVDLLVSGGSLPSPLAVSTTYYLIAVDEDTLQFATTIGNAEAGTAIDLTTTGTASQTFTIQELLLSTDARTSSVNNTLKTYAHTTYNPRYSRWDSSHGQGNLTGTMTIDVLMPTNNVDATTTLARVSMIGARANRFIEIPETSLLSVGIWDNTSGQRKFLEGSISFNAGLVGAVGAVERRFRALLTSDRGFQLLSDEVTLPATPANLTDTNFIQMSWGQQAGQLQVDIYEHYDPGGPDDEYRLVTQVSSATSFIYEGGYQVTVPGYPTPTGEIRNATFVTQTADMSDLVVNGSSWETINFPIGVPNNYNKGLTTNRQWVRIWMTEAMNLFITQVTTDGSDTITIPSGAINSAAVNAGGYGSGGSSLYVGLVVEVYDEDDVLLATTGVASVTSDTVLVLDDTIAAGTDRKIRIVEGGFHGVLIDKVHLGYQQNTSYAPNAQDNRTLQPVAAPDGSSQGGVGSGGIGGGIDPCVVGSTLIERYDHEWYPIDSYEEGDVWDSGDIHPNTVIRIKKSPQMERVRLVRAANGVEVTCTDGEAFKTSPNDIKGTFLFRLRVGDTVMTKLDGRIESTTIEYISPYCGMEYVYTPTLSNSKLFIGGEWKGSRLKAWIWRKLFGRKLVGGFVLHNRKLDIPI